MKKGMDKNLISKWKYKVIATIIAFLMFLPNAFAESSYTNLYAFSFGTHQNTPFQFGLGAGASSTYDFGVVVDTGKVSYNYLTMNICATISPDLAGITNANSSVQYFVEEYKLVNNHSTCYVNNNKGNGYYLFLQIGKWNIGSQTSDASTKLTFKNNSSWYGLIRVNSLVLGNTDDSVDISGLNAIFESNSELKDAITNSSSQINGNLNDIESSINNTNDKLDDANDKLNDLYEQNQETHDRLHSQIKEQEKTNENLDEIIESDLSEEDKQKPNDQGYQNYTESENELKDKVNQADLSNVSIGIDANSSSWVWDTLTRLIQSHSAVFGMFIAILSIGIIKLALGR